MTTRIKLRRDTAANWTSHNPILAAGEPGLETDTGKTKHGDGATHWANLSYSTGGITARQIVGSFTGYGPSIPNTSGYDIWFDTVVADPEGNAYYVGGQNDTSWVVAVKVDTEGAVVWEKEITWADGSEGSGTSAVYNTATDRLVVLSSFWKNVSGGQQDSSAAVITLDPIDGSIMGDPLVLRDDVITDGSSYGHVWPYDIILTASGDPVVSGEMTGAPTFYSVTTATGSTVNDLFVDSAQFLNDYPSPYDNWYVTGTNITSEIYVTGVNYYYNQPATPVTGGTGTNAIFDITADGAGGYTIVLGTDQGSGYQYLNQILVLGSLLGGADGANDATVTVTGVDAGVITSVSVNGASVGSSTYTGVGGTNIPSGQNATFNAEWRMKGSQIWFPNYGNEKFGVYPQQSGSGFAIGDTLALPSSSYGGTTTGTITVVNVDGSGVITDWAFTGTFKTDTIKITTDNYYSADYGVADGAYTVHNYESDAFVWSPNWATTFGGSRWDVANALDRDSAGNVYVACKTRDNSVNGGTNRAMLVKLSNTGTFVWSKNFDTQLMDNGHWDNDGYTGVAVDSNGDIIVVQDSEITKVDSDGTVMWQKIIGWNDPMSLWNACVDVDSDNNIYIAAEYDYLGQNTNNDYILVKFDTDGNVVWQRDAGTGSGENTQWNNGYQIITVQGNKFYVCGSTYQGNDNIGLGFNMPTDGSGATADITFAGRYFYRETDWEVTTSTATMSDMAIEFRSTEFTAYNTNTFAVNTLTNVSETRSIRSGDVDGRINNLYSVSFEDGSVQKTAYIGGLSQGNTSPRIYNTNNYDLTLADAGKMTRWYADGWNTTQWIYIPTHNEAPFPVGTEMYFMKDQGVRTMFFMPKNGNNAITIIPAQPADYKYYAIYYSGEGWSVHHPSWDQVPCIITLTCIDINRWLLSCNSPVQIMDWSY